MSGRPGASLWPWRTAGGSHTVCASHDCVAHNASGALRSNGAWRRRSRPGPTVPRQCPGDPWRPEAHPPQAGAREAVASGRRPRHLLAPTDRRKWKETER